MQDTPFWRFEEIPPERDLESLSCAEFQDVDVPMKALFRAGSEVWELAEALGTWRQDEHGTILTCQWAVPTLVRDPVRHWAWKGSHPKAPMVLEPSLENRRTRFSARVDDGRQHLDDLLAREELQLCYVQRSGSEVDLSVLGCLRFLELQTKGHPSGEPNEWLAV